MVGKRSSKTDKYPKLNKTAKARRTSLVIMTSATKALKKVTPSSKTIQSLLASATLMHPEILPDGVSAVANNSSPSDKTGDAGQQSLVQHLLAADLNAHLPMKTVSSSNDAGHIQDTMPQPQSANSLRRRTFPPSIEFDYCSQSPFKLQRIESPGSTQRSSGSDQSSITIDITGPGHDNLLRNFRHGPVHIHGSQRIQLHDIEPMIELHLLAWRDDRLLQRLQRSQVSSAESQIMMKMLGERTTSPLDNVLVARINKSHDPADIVGWLACSIVRFKIGNRKLTMENEVRAMGWNLATAAILNISHNAGSTTCLLGDTNTLMERNYLIKVLCKGTRWSQKQEFRDQDFIAITNLVVHPKYPHGREIAKRLVLEACDQASLLRMPLYVSSSGEYCEELFKEECGFVELGEHASFMFDPVYTMKHLIFRPSPGEPDLTIEEGTSSRFDFGWKAIRGS